MSILYVPKCVSARDDPAQPASFHFSGKKHNHALLWKTNDSSLLCPHSANSSGTTGPLSTWIYICFGPSSSSNTFSVLLGFQAESQSVEQSWIQKHRQGMILMKGLLRYTVNMAFSRRAFLVCWTHPLCMLNRTMWWGWGDGQGENGTSVMLREWICKLTGTARED